MGLGRRPVGGALRSGCATMTSVKLPLHSQSSVQPPRSYRLGGGGAADYIRRTNTLDARSEPTVQCRFAHYGYRLGSDGYQATPEGRRAISDG